jgi:P-type conjugative transfer protein TrbJ
MTMRNLNLNTAALNPTTPKPHGRRRKALAALALAIGSAMAFGPVRRAAACWYDPIIFDPQALVQNVQKVVQLVQQVESAAQQVQNQLHELAHLTNGVAPDVPAVVAGIQGQLDASLYSTASPAGQLDARFPADMSNVTWNQFQSDAATWTANQRQALAENRQLENQVYRDMDMTRQQVQGIVEASNAASGETAAVQAHNDLMAVASGELAKLQTLKAARSRLKTERLARQQSELSYAAAEQGRVRADWGNPAPPTGSVTDPFQN